MCYKNKLFFYGKRIKTQFRRIRIYIWTSVPSLKLWEKHEKNIRRKVVKYALTFILILRICRVSQTGVTGPQGSTMIAQRVSNVMTKNQTYALIKGSRFKHKLFAIVNHQVESNRSTKFVL